MRLSFQSVFSRAFLVSVLLWAGPLSAQSSNDRYCSATGRVAVFAVDITTPYDTTDKSIIVGMTDKILESLKGGDRLVIRTIVDSYTRSERLIERCVPYCPANGTLGRLFNCSDGVLRTDKERMKIDAIGAMRSRLGAFRELKYSDIVRTVFGIATEEAKNNQPFTLYIYSDLIENSDYFSPRYLFSYSTDKLIAGLHHYRLIAPLKNAEIVVSGVGRWDGKDRRPLNVNELNKLTDFWKAYFKESGAQSISISQNPL